MPGKPPVLLIDDGELDDLRAMLEEFGASYEWVRGCDVPDQIEHPEDLFITTANQGVRLQYQGGFHRKPKRPVRIAVGTGSTKTQRAALKRAGFDFLVHRPVHPSALRLLLLHSLYRGKEKRHSTRYPFGYTVTYRVRFRRRKALLAELSADGCRLISDNFPQPGTWATVQIPAEVAGGRTLDLRGRVVRGDRRNQRGGKVTIGIQFEGLDPSTEERLRSILVDRYWGPAMLPGRPPAPRAARPSPAPPPPPVTKEAPRGTTPEEEFDDSLMANTAESIPVPDDVEIEVGTDSATDEPEFDHSPHDLATDAGPMSEVPEASATPEPLAREPLPGEEVAQPQGGFESIEIETDEPSADGPARRKNPRVSYGGEVIAMAEAVSRVLVGRDLSCEGMRVDPHPRISLGDRVRLAIYSAGHEEPFIIGASVVRDDAESGLALRFEEMDDRSQERLADLIESLPPIEPIGSPDGTTVVFSEVLDPD